MNVKPDLLTFHDGSTVDAASWPRRRKELADAIIPHEFGGMPPAHESVAIIRRATSRVRQWQGIQYCTYEIRTQFPGGGEISLTLSLWKPPGDGPFSVLLDADGCWRYFNDDVIYKVLERGYIAASLDRTEAAADNPAIVSAKVNKKPPLVAASHDEGRIFFCGSLRPDHPRGLSEAARDPDASPSPRPPVGAGTLYPSSGPIRRPQRAASGYRSPPCPTSRSSPAPTHSISPLLCPGH